jgi:hypothetical protein
MFAFSSVLHLFTDELSGCVDGAFPSRASRRERSSVCRSGTVKPPIKGCISRARPEPVEDPPAESEPKPPYTVEKRTR